MITDVEAGLARGFRLTQLRTEQNFQAAVNEVAAERNQALRERNAALEQVAALQAALTKQIIHSAGLSGQVLAMKLAHPDSPLLKETGKVYEDGRKQNFLLHEYDKAHDHEARKRKVDPAKLRFVTK